MIDSSIVSNMEGKSGKKAEDAQPLDPTLTLADQNVYLGLHGDATGCRNPRRVTDYFKSVSSNPADVNAAAADTNANTKSDATELNLMLSSIGEDSPDGAVDSDIELEFDEIDEEKKTPPTKQRAKNPIVDAVVILLSDEEEATDNDSTDNDEDYESDEEKKPPSTKRKAKLEGKYRQGATANKRSRKSPPVAAAAAAGNKHGSAPIIYIGGYKAASREYKDYLHFLAINRKGSPWSDCHYGCLRNRFTGHDFILITNGQETKPKKPEIIKSAAQMYKTILKKLRHAQEQVTNERAERNDNNPIAATRLCTAPLPALAAAVPQASDATAMHGGTDDIGNVLNTFVSVLRTRKEAAFISEDDDVCAQGLKIKKFITHVEKGRATLGL